MVSDRPVPKAEYADNLLMVPVASWNIAAVNNNPFEYWITNPHPAYDQLMQGVQKILEDSKYDTPVDEIFTHAMFSELLGEMSLHNIDGLSLLEICWKDDFSKRKIVSEFLNDEAISSKRLASMPDRITNTINVSGGGCCKRPSVINSYDGGSLSSIAIWWEQWKAFMFHTNVVISNPEKQCSVEPQPVCSLIGPISRHKYPAISENEQCISVPLQILCLAILDAIFVHIVNLAKPGSSAASQRRFF